MCLGELERAGHAVAAGLLHRVARSSQGAASSVSLRGNDHLQQDETQLAREGVLQLQEQHQGRLLMRRASVMRYLFLLIVADVRPRLD